MTIKVKGQDYELDEISITNTQLDEMETTIVITKTEDELKLYTSDNIYLTKIKNAIKNGSLDWKIVDIIKRNDGSISGVKAIAPKTLITLRAKNRELSDERLETLRQHVKKLHASGALKRG